MTRLTTWFNSVSFTTKILVSVFVCCIIGDTYLFSRTIDNLTELNIKRAEETAQMQIVARTAAAHDDSSGAYSYLKDFCYWIITAERSEKEIKEQLAATFKSSKVLSPNTYSIRLYLIEDNLKHTGKIFEYSDQGYYEKQEVLPEICFDKEVDEYYFPIRKIDENFYVLPLLYPLFDKTGRHLGSIEIATNISKLYDSSSWKNPLLVKEGTFNGALYELDGFGSFILFPDPEVRYKKTLNELATENNNPTLKKLAVDLNEGKKGYIELDKGFTYKEPVLMFYGINPYDEALGSSVQGTWKYIFEVKKKDVYAKINEVKERYFFSFLIYLAVIFVLLQFICRSVTQPVRHLAAIARSYGKGNFELQPPLIQGKNELADLSRAFNFMRENLVNLIDKEKKEAAQAQQRKTELDLAQKIQANALPTDFPVNPAFEVSAFMHAAKEVGGDLYDFFFVDKTHFAFLVADVTGKGMPAALFMMTAQAQIRSALQSGLELKDACEKINATLCKTSQDTVFITAFIAIVDIKTGVVEYVSAGHNPPVLRRKDGTSLLEGENSIPLAAMEDVPYFVNRVTLAPSEGLFLYTDGVTEARNEEKEFYGTERLTTLLNHEAASQECIERVFENVQTFEGKAEQSDDITMLCITYRGKNKT